MILAVIGFFAATIILSIISWVEQQTSTDLGFLNFILGLFQFGILISLIIAYFYYRNEQEFQRQMQKLKHTFEKIEKGEEDDEISKEVKNKISALGVSRIWYVSGRFWHLWVIISALYHLHCTMADV